MTDAISRDTDALFTSTIAKQLLQRCICFSVYTIEKRMVAVKGKRASNVLKIKENRNILKRAD